MSSSRKRKNRSGHGTHWTENNNNLTFTTSDAYPSTSSSALYIQAYEADIIRGPAAEHAALSLQAPRQLNTVASPSKVGEALIKWDGAQHLTAQPAFPGDEIEDGFRNATRKPADQAGHVIWLDRYDARLLLDTLPPPETKESHKPLPASPGGWSDLPSDDEDAFFFSQEEAEDFRREKKRRHIEQIREERLKARRAEDGESSDEEDVWGGSDEEPEGAQSDLMRRTATHILSSPNPAQLEMRILANHGSDKRFAFLRGRWSRTWKLFKAKAKLERDQEQKKQKAGSLSVLAGYGDSDASDSGDAADDRAPRNSPPLPAPTAPPYPPPPEDENAAKEARQLRAKEWAEQRRLLKGKAT
ncbi:hypothetical protein H0H81_011951 [Sphagnurus paluster]|uniref:Uncharacterized protein n=1 Tax=Sphagnurus paluster TaxID=117069 RepID=A0A9P7KJ89_9AGAR|nr:hypothetical protein H0H81_011951 [Sphagnurus paluster]